MTQYWTVDPRGTLTDPAIAEAGKRLRQGELIAFPTETVYGLGADARNSEAVQGIFKAKGRPSDNPLIVHIAEIDQLNELTAEVSETARRLMDAFWPGPLTIVLPVKPGAIAPQVTAGLTTVAVRMPDHPVALSLIRASGCPIAAPSANRSGRPSPTRAEHVSEDMDGRIAGIVDGGPTGVGVESTVVEIRAEAGGDHIHILRPGGIGKEELQPYAASVISAKDSAMPNSEQPRSPGMKYTHYAPRGRMTLVVGSKRETVVRWIGEHIKEAQLKGERTGVLTFIENAPRYEADLVIPCGSLADPRTTARELYSALRRFDEYGISYILAEAGTTEGIGAAVFNRMVKAAGNRVIHL